MIVEQDRTEVLLTRGASIDGTNDEDRTALREAACWSHTEVMKILLDRAQEVLLDWGVTDTMGAILVGPHKPAERSVPVSDLLEV